MDQLVGICNRFIIFLFFVIFAQPVLSQEVCDFCGSGVTEKTILPNGSFDFCWEPNHPNDNVVNYIIYKDREPFDTVNQSDICDDCCCYSQKYTISEQGDYVFNVTAVDADNFESDFSNNSYLHVEGQGAIPSVPTGIGLEW